MAARLAFPRLVGGPIRVEVRASLGPHLAATWIRRRLVRLDREVLLRAGEFERILIHEIFHFVWVRLSNAERRSWETVLARELRAGVAGELGWSAEWRKAKLDRSDAASRSPRWRRYACESFCDSAAWLFSRIGRHGEFTLGGAARRIRADWFRRKFPATRALPI